MPCIKLNVRLALISLFRFCHTIYPLISGTIFVQFALIGSVLGLTLINIFFFSNIWRGLSSSVFFVAVLMETFPFCYNCNLLMDDCDELANGLFQSKWVDAEKRYKQTLIQFMHQAQQHILFIAGGIIPITMNSNITVSNHLVYINITFKICSTFS